jgi:ABC-type lipoprotein release transport system permease subunit
MDSSASPPAATLPDSESDAVIIGRGLAESMHAKPGDYLTLMTTTTAGSLNAMDVRVAGIFMTGVKEYDERAVKMPIAGAQQLLQTKKIEKLLVLLKNTDDTAGRALRARGARARHRDQGVVGARAVLPPGRRCSITASSASSASSSSPSSSSAWRTRS